jgi:excisionase family DNA binding protein
MAEWEYLTVRELAEYLQLNMQTVRNWITRGELESIKLGRAVRIPRKAAVAVAGGEGWELPELMTIDQVSALFQLNRQTLYNWIDAGTLPAVSLGSRRYRIKKSVLDEMVEAGVIVPKPNLIPTQSADDFWMGTEEVGELVFAQNVSQS